MTEKLREQKTLREELAILLSGLASLSPQTDEQNHYFWKGMHQYWKNNWLIKADSIILKLQQAGWKDATALEARIKELEASAALWRAVGYK
jgi:hypothetical protein